MADHDPQPFGSLPGPASAAEPSAPAAPSGLWPFPIPLVGNGMAVREQHSPTVFVLAGHAKFAVPSPAELFALGYDWSKVQVVPDGTLASWGQMPARGTLVRARDQPAVFYSLGPELLLIPTPDTMRLLALPWSDVTVVPAGSLATLPQRTMPSAFPTPASVAFPDDRNHLPRPEIPGYDLPNGSHICEVRGWLTPGGVDPSPSATDPDWHLQLLPDPAWIDSTGADWTRYFTVGDILAMGQNPLTNDQQSEMARAATPTWHVEVNGWRGGDHPDANPLDWTVNSSTGGQLDHVVWPYLPTVSGGRPGGRPLQAGDYVRMVGNVCTDIPHEHPSGGGIWEFTDHTFGIGSSGPYGDAAQAWGGNLDEHDGRHQARWTEIHPPDLIEYLDDRPITEAVFGVTCVARAAVLDPLPVRNEITVDLRPIGPRPAGARVGIREYLGPETNLDSIVEGNDARTGARITVADDHATVHVKVQGAPFDGVAGKFKAVYRLTWQV